ncbi:hypothetical protein ACOMHN_033491 [Nucella lapillus]
MVNSPNTMSRPSNRPVLARTIMGLTLSARQGAWERGIVLETEVKESVPSAPDITSKADFNTSQIARSFSISVQQFITKTTSAIYSIFINKIPDPKVEALYHRYIVRMRRGSLLMMLTILLLYHPVQIVFYYLRGCHMPLSGIVLGIFCVICLLLEVSLGFCSLCLWPNNS